MRRIWYLAMGVVIGVTIVMVVGCTMHVSFDRHYHGEEQQASAQSLVDRILDKGLHDVE